jgi:hypothetical protein
MNHVDDGIWLKDNYFKNSLLTYLHESQLLRGKPIANGIDFSCYPATCHSLKKPIARQRRGL